MNRLKETRLQRPVSQWLLASAYALSNQQEIATKMIRDLSFEVTPYRETGGTFGSTTRDNALILQSMVILNMQQDAYRMLEKISKAMGSAIGTVPRKPLSLFMQPPSSYKNTWAAKKESISQ